ncbi:metallophosphoesterase family protein [Haliovirga abyssi]|uniref:Serine/threonine protein phosphatase n=1 Tax=Haliovirga abyssi TaxID=2996794 RepID=A0AAU9D2E7_9FUSO|nr:metallophosphoesterase [Haliovirga abyssi]BDU50164.1 serine/threonine protein phosphatase [Haliovirga abyssi]
MKRGKKDYKILIVSDEDMLKIFSVSQLKEKFGYVDFIISAGDVSNGYLDYLFSALDKDVIYVNGNHIYEQNHKIEFCKNIDGKIIKYKNIKILGLDGSRVYSFGEHQYTEYGMWKKILKQIIKIAIRRPDIVVTHAPIRGIHDKEDHVHKGFRAFRYILKYCKPKLWIHGHIHLSSQYEKQETIVNGTRIINAYGYKVIELKK